MVAYRDGARHVSTTVLDGNVKALILAGGLGTRLRPLTYTRPKHLLPIANRPHIDHVFDLLGRHGFNEVVVLTSYLPEAFAGSFAAARGRGFEVETALEEEPLGTAGAIKNGESFVGDETFVVFNGDILTDVDLDWVVTRHRANGAEATIVLTPVEDPSAYGVVPTDEHARVLGFIEKPDRESAVTNLINAGIYVFEPSVLERVPPGEVWSAERQLFPGLVNEDAALYAVGTDAYWLDIGTPQSYLRANHDALTGAYRSDVATTGGNALAPGAVVADSAVVHGSSVGPGARIEPDAAVDGSVLLPGARVERGARVTRSVLGEGARVGTGAEVEDRVLGDGDTT